MKYQGHFSSVMQPAKPSWSAKAVDPSNGMQDDPENFPKGATGPLGQTG